MFIKTCKWMLQVWLCAGMTMMVIACDDGSSVQQAAGTDTEEMSSGTPVAVVDEQVEEVVADTGSPKVLTPVSEFTLTNQNGAAVDNESLFGRVWVANFIFTQCQDSCPLQTEEMKRLQKYLKTLEKWDDLRLVSFTVDPEHDTPAVLTKYMADRAVDADHWDFLTGDKEEMRALVTNGFRLPVMEESQNSDMPILHSQQFVLVDWEGRIRGYYDSLDAGGVADLKRDIGLVMDERKPFPEGILDAGWLMEKKAQQIKAAGNYGVFHDFGFTDRTKESAITFQHRMVDDVGRDYKAVHYDHGNGLSVADVDGDGNYDIYFTTQAGSNELWRNLGDGRFEDITDQSGLRYSKDVGVSASFADIDNDGDSDLYVTYVRAGNRLYENDGQGHFSDITEQAGVGIKAHSSGVLFFDYDRDGLLDLFVCNVGVYTTDEIANVTIYSKEKGHEVSDYRYYVGFKDGFSGHLKPERTETSVLFRNLGDNRFEDVSEKTGLVDGSWSGDAIIIDANNDGWPDVYLLDMEGHDEYYENQEGKRFVKKSRELFPKTSWGAMGAKAFDYDNDGDQDIFVTDMHSDMSEEIGPDKEKQKSDMKWSESFLESGGNSIFGNTFFRNNGDGTYEEISDSIGVENYWPWGVSVGDVNADGFEDVFIASSMNYPFRYGINSLLLNDHGKTFLDSEFVLGVEPRLHDRVALPWFELQCSGADAGRQMCGKDATGRKVVWGVPGSRSSVIFDIDQDGDMDIVTLEFNTQPLVLVSDLDKHKDAWNFIKIRLQGVKSNRSGIGAVIRVVAGEHAYTRVNDGKSGYLSQSDYPVYFGLGADKEVDRIEVSWPSGVTQVLEGPVAVNQLLEITEQ